MADRLKVLGILLIPAYNIYSLVLMTAGDAWISSRWGPPAFTAGLWVGSLALAELLHRFEGRRPGWVLGLIFSAGLLSFPFLGCNGLTGMWLPQVFPNKDVFKYKSIPYIGTRIRPAFRELRLAFSRSHSVMQGRDHVSYLVGSPRPAWRDAFYARLASTSPPSGPAAGADQPVVEECLLRSDQACLDAFLRSEPSGAPLAAFLKTPFRIKAAIALARLRHPEALPVLIKALGNRKDPPGDVVAVSEALGEYGLQSAEAVPLIIWWASERQRLTLSGFQLEFIRPLLRIGSPEAFEYVGTRADKAATIEEAMALREALDGLSPAPESAANLRRLIDRALSRLAAPTP